MLCVPMRVEGHVIGALEVLNKPSGFTERDAALLGLSAHFAASAVESKRLWQEAIKAKIGTCHPCCYGTTTHSLHWKVEGCR
jgi:GAF domain-containing protein